MVVISVPAGEYPGLAYDGSITFAGVLQDVFYRTDSQGVNTGISRKWNDNTAEQYRRNYLERLLPAIKRLLGVVKPMHEYTESDFEVVLSELNKNYHYAESAIMHYRYLLWIVYRAGFELGLYPDNIFWDDLIDPLDDPDEFEKHRTAALTRIRKSLSIEEDIRTMHWFRSLDPITASGPDVALTCMYFLGLRNNEACGANFGTFHTLLSYPEAAVFDMVRSTGIGNNQLKSGGKTYNAPRTLPVPAMLYQFIQKRRAWIEKQIDKGNISLPPDIKSVDQLPVACVGNNYTVRAQTSDLSKAGRALFQRIGIHKSELAVLHQIMFSEEFRQTQIIEKDPTTYLFRRNVATRLYHLGFPWTTIQYWIAHEIEDTLKMRNFFADEDILHTLGQKYEMHPIFCNQFRKKAKAHHEQHFLSANNSLHIMTVSNEPGSKIIISVDSTKPVDISCTELPFLEECGIDVSILNSLYQAYSRAYKQLLH